MPLQRKRVKVQTEERKEGRKGGRKKETKKTKKEVKAISIMSCYSPSHPSPVPEQRSCSQEDQQQQHQHCNQYRDCACSHTELKTNSLIKQNSRNLCYQRHCGRADSRPPEPEASPLATDSQRCPSQPGEHLHTNTDTNTR